MFARPRGTDDIFIPPDEINGAMQGDHVLVELAPAALNGRRLGRIARVLERRNPTVVGTFHYGVPSERSSSLGWQYARSDREHANHVVPFDERMSSRFIIPPEGQELPAAETATPHTACWARKPRSDSHCG